MAAGSYSYSYALLRLLKLLVLVWNVQWASAVLDTDGTGDVWLQRERGYFGGGEEDVGDIIWRKRAPKEATIELDGSTASASIKVTYPADMTTFQQGEVFPIRWTSRGLSPTASVKIELYLEEKHPAHFIRTITHGTPGVLRTSEDVQTGDFDWLVHIPPYISPDHFFKVVISSCDDPHIFGVQPGKFRVVDKRGHDQGQATQPWEDYFSVNIK